MSVSTADVAKIIEDAIPEKGWPIFLYSEYSERNDGSHDWTVMLAGEFRDFLITITPVERKTRDEPIELW